MPSIIKDKSSGSKTELRKLKLKRRIELTFLFLPERMQLEDLSGLSVIQLLDLASQNTNGSSPIIASLFRPHENHFLSHGSASPSISYDQEVSLTLETSILSSNSPSDVVRFGTP